MIVAMKIILLKQGFDKRFVAEREILNGNSFRCGRENPF